MCYFKFWNNFIVFQVFFCFKFKSISCLNLRSMRFWVLLAVKFSCYFDDKLKIFLKFCCKMWSIRQFILISPCKSGGFEFTIFVKFFDVFLYAKCAKIYKSNISIRVFKISFSAKQSSYLLGSLMLLFFDSIKMVPIFHTVFISLLCSFWVISF